MLQQFSDSKSLINTQHQVVMENEGASAPFFFTVINPLLLDVAQRLFSPVKE